MNLLVAILALLTAMKVESRIHPFQSSHLMALGKVSAPVSRGSRALFSVTLYKQENNTMARNIRLIDKDSVNSLTTVSFGTMDSNPVWLSDELVAFLRNGQIWTVDINDRVPRQLSFYPVEVSNLKSHTDSHQLAFTAQVYSDGDMDTAAVLDKKESERFDSGVVYGIPLPTPCRPALCSTLGSNGFSSLVVIVGHSSPMRGTNLETPPSPLGDESYFSFSPEVSATLSQGTEIAFTCRLPRRDAAWNTNNDIFVVPTDGSAQPVSVSSENLGADTLPFYSFNGKYLAWLRMETPAYESDLNRIVLLDRITREKKVFKSWDRGVNSAVFSPSDRFIYLSAHDVGFERLFKLDLETEVISTLVSDGHNNGISVQSDQDGTDLVWFLRASPVAAPEIYSLTASSEPLPRSRINDKLLSHTLRSEPEEVWFEGAMGEQVHGWFWKPTIFSSSSKYPLAMIIHGGPEDSWSSDFSFRWNPQIWAGSGYAVFAINFHGSTGFGSRFTRSILNNWGGAPYEDIIKGLDHILDTRTFLDRHRVCALGASYGGYMINWLNGHAGERFACMVNHDGIFDLRAFYSSTEELYFPEFEFGGSSYDPISLANMERWNPALYVSKWTTPTLVIHGEQDYRIGIADGLSTFTALQRQGVPSRLLYFKDECLSCLIIGHWVLKPANSLKWYKTLGDWLDRWTSLEPDEQVKEWRRHRKNLKKHDVVVTDELK